VNRRDRELQSQAKFDAVMAVRRERADRNQHMKQLRNLGWTLEGIGKIYGLSRQRVHQIINEATSHLPKGVKPPRIPRDYVKHNGRVPHGTLTGYIYGCRKDCPATPTCQQRRRDYQNQRNQQRRERRAFEVDPF
jgi:DNA-binding transcriptional MerR regulator